MHTPSGTDCFRTLPTQHSRITVSLSTSAVTRMFASDDDDDGGGGDDDDSGGGGDDDDDDDDDDDVTPC